MYIDILRDLIHFQSVTPYSSGAIEYIGDLLTKNGFRTEIKVFGEGLDKVTNLYSVYGDAKPEICFAGHVDVVPAGDLSLWDNFPFQATIIDNKIYGRGAVDMKGAIACYIAAVLNFIKVYKPNGSISFLITSDEEGKAKYGTVEMLKYLHQSTNRLFDLAIIGEPTNETQIGDTVKIGRRGSTNFSLTIYGTAGHVAYPSQANNPIAYLIKILNDLANYELDQGNKFFQKSNLEITSIDSDNYASNVIPEKITAKFNIRFNNFHSSSSISNLVKGIIDKYNIRYQLDISHSADCFIQEPVGLMADFVQIVADTTKVQTKLSTSGGTSDARFIKDYCPVVEFGLCHAMAHKINEYTEIIDLQRLYDVYYNSLVKFLS